MLLAATCSRGRGEGGGKEGGREGGREVVTWGGERDEERVGRRDLVKCVEGERERGREGGRR